MRLRSGELGEEKKADSTCRSVRTGAGPDTDHGNDASSIECCTALVMCVHHSRRGFNHRGDGNHSNTVAAVALLVLWAPALRPLCVLCQSDVIVTPPPPKVLAPLDPQTPTVASIVVSAPPHNAPPALVQQVCVGSASLYVHITIAPHCERVAPPSMKSTDSDMCHPTPGR
ncbi:hypothetical protein IAQ61_010281 [Plenodomus lingam]|uniref:uncharacterized protein n=1 Tax=Leptosphaeria maculans TaxID=5022 RepID=UPI003328B619|nr:hypothetical protein IAQ61_010281 [Plenodomus lingam]